MGFIKSPVSISLNFTSWTKLIYEKIIEIYRVEKEFNSKGLFLKYHFENPHFKRKFSKWELQLPLE